MFNLYTWYITQITYTLHESVTTLMTLGTEIYYGHDVTKVLSIGRAAEQALLNTEYRFPAYLPKLLHLSTPKLYTGKSTNTDN